MRVGVPPASENRLRLALDLEAFWGDPGYMMTQESCTHKSVVF